ncbi:hypothetical protein [Streptomyces sp. NPDC089799]|uniref:hypothetical protein n=1 Tax=Streptomyces sp. NPDC089799 TaxID=3155066 RepID=UPI0034353424
MVIQDQTSGSIVFRIRLCIPLACAAALVLSGCSDDSNPKASDSPPPTAAEIKYHDCLKKEGLAVVYEDNGAPRLAKTDPAEKISAAEKACESQRPPVEPVSSETLAEEQRWVDCLRRQGLTWIPDPDPSTGTVPLTAEQMGGLKRQHGAALQECKSDGARKHDDDNR